MRRASRAVIALRWEPQEFVNLNVDEAIANHAFNHIEEQMFDSRCQFCKSELKEAQS